MTSEDQAVDHPVRELFVYLAVRGAEDALRFYAAAFLARETALLRDGDGRIIHAEMRLGDILLMLAEEELESGFTSPLSLGGTGAVIHLHVRDVDALAARAIEAGASLLRPPADESHGERQALLRDPFGHKWLLGHPLPGSCGLPGEG